jgi:hypothetical protein
VHQITGEYSSPQFPATIERVIAVKNRYHNPQKQPLPKLQRFFKDWTELYE